MGKGSASTEMDVFAMAASWGLKTVDLMGAKEMPVPLKTDEGSLVPAAAPVSVSLNLDPVNVSTVRIQIRCDSMTAIR